MRPLDVRVLVSGEYLLTLHEERGGADRAGRPDIAEGRSEQYVVYAGSLMRWSTSFAALNQLEQTLDDLMVAATDVRAGRVRTATLQEMISGLARMRRRAGPQRDLFERIGVEIEGLPEGSNRIDLRLKQMSYLLTAVAAVFLPLTFLVGFFGMNFEWMIGEIDTQLFWLLEVGVWRQRGCVADRGARIPDTDRGDWEGREEPAPPGDPHRPAESLRGSKASGPIGAAGVSPW